MDKIADIFKYVGTYPEGYNAKIHGPFDPSRYYGKRDIPFGEVKIGELPAWFGRRNKTPFAIGRAITRGYWRWNMKYVLPLRAGPAFLYQTCAALSLFSYIMYYPRLQLENVQYKYH